MTLTALITIALDQTSKIGIVHLLGLKTRGEIEVFPPFLNFRMAWNQGVNFGLFSSNASFTRWFLIGLALVISVWVIWWVRRDRMRPLAQVFAGLLVGGAIGNVIDRLVYGAVADFLNMSCCGIENPWAFNIADIAIFTGAIGLVLFSSTKKSDQETP